ERLDEGTLADARHSRNADSGGASGSWKHALEELLRGELMIGAGALDERDRLRETAPIARENAVDERPIGHASLTFLIALKSGPEPCAPRPGSAFRVRRRRPRRLFSANRNLAAGSRRRRSRGFREHPARPASG